MSHQTEVSKRLAIKYPLVQGPFGAGLSSTKLVVSVSEAGGLGSYGVYSMSAPQITKLAEEIRCLTVKPFVLNLWIPQMPATSPTPEDLQHHIALFDNYFAELGISRPKAPERFGQDYDSQIRAILDVRPPVFSFVFGIPEPTILQECRTRGIATIGTATTPDEAVALDAAGVDCIVASGFEAGGHRGSFLRPAEECLMGTFALVPQVVDRVKAPVIAAGGIADCRGIKAAFALGAQGAQIGTAFLACEESGTSPDHRALLFDERCRQTVLTKVFTGRLARSIRNRLIEELGVRDQALLPYPMQGWLTGSLRPAAVARGRTDLIALSSGQAAPLIRAKDAATLFAELVRGLVP
jgi:nitronate monooxygenase